MKLRIDKTDEMYYKGKKETRKAKQKCQMKREKKGVRKIEMSVKRRERKGREKHG